MIRTTAALAAVLALAAPALADEEGVEHYAAEPSETLEEAVANFADYNARLADVLERDDLSVSDMERVHELTYTLETALALINERMAALPDTLERLHQSSEAHDAADVREAGAAYLDTARTVID